jgi:hypothetical protein
MANINRKNYNAAGKSGFENSPAKVWHVNELVGTTIGYKSVAGYINFLADNTETVTILTNDTGYPDTNITIADNGGSRAILNLTFDFPGNIYRYTSCLGNLNLDDQLNTYVNTLSIAKNSASTTENIIYRFTIQRITSGTPAALSIGTAQPQIIYFEFKVFI